MRPDFKRLRSFIFSRVLWEGPLAIFWGSLRASYLEEGCVGWESREEELCPSLQVGRPVANKYQNEINFFECQERGSLLGDPTQSLYSEAWTL